MRLRTEVRTMTDQEVNAVVMPQAVRVPARLDYRKLDPYAVRIWVQLRPLKWTGWVFARDLLAGGLKERCGDGAVTVEPHPKLSNTVRMTLSNADMDATFHFQHSDLDTFLDLTFEEVAYGEENLRYSKKWFAAESKRFWEQERTGGEVE